MKLLFIVPDISTAGGVEKIVAQLTDYLVEVHEHEVTILNCIPLTDFTFYPINSRVGLHSLAMPSYPKGTIAKIYWYYQLTRALSNYFRSHHYELVFAQGGYVAASLCRVKTKAAKIGCDHVSYASMHFLHRLCTKILFKKLDAVVVLTDQDKLAYQKFLQKVYTIPNFIPASSHAMRDQKKPLIVAAGRLVHQKGFDLLISAFELVNRKHPFWKLHIYGEGKARTVLQEQINKSGLQHHIILMGQKKELNDHLANGAIFVLSSRYEGLPLILLEAMYLGLSCISFDITGISGILQNGVNGLLVPRNNIVELAAAIDTLISNEGLRKRMAEKARSTAQQYEIKEIGKYWQILIEQIAKRTNEV